MKKMIQDSNINPLAGDLLLKMLRFNPSKRISVQEAIAHPYFQEYSKILGEPPQVPKKFDWSWEQGFFSRGILQKLIYWESMQFQQQISESHSVTSHSPQKGQTQQIQPPTFVLQKEEESPK